MRRYMQSYSNNKDTMLDSLHNYMSVPLLNCQIIYASPFLDPCMHIYMLDWMLMHLTIPCYTRGSLCGNIHRHSWSTLSLVDSSNGHRVSSVGAQVMERV